MESGRQSGEGGARQGAPQAARVLGTLLEGPGTRRLSEPQVRIILDALAGARDPALVARFPAVLALCGRRGLRVDFQKLLARHWETSPRRRNLEDLLCVSALLLRRLGAQAPEGLAKTVSALRGRAAALEGRTALRLADGTTVALSDFAAALNKATAEPAAPVAPRPAAPPSPRESAVPDGPGLAGRLEALFPEKQIELILKRLRGEPLTKTEREYFSRIVRKKLAAIADVAVQEAAARLLAGKRRGKARRGRPRGV